MCVQGINGQDFHEMHARLHGSNNLVTLDKIGKKRFTFLTDGIAEPRPDMNIKVTAFTMTQKLYSTYYS